MAAGDLTTVPKVRQFFGIQNNDDDARIGSLITACSKAITQYLSRNLLAQEYTAERYDGNDSDILMLKAFPVVSVSLVTINGVTQSASSDGLLQAGYYPADTYIFLVGGARFPRGRNNVIVTYTAGYSTVPEDVVEACIEMVGDRYKLPSRLGERSKALQQGGSVSYDMENMSARVKGLLSPYRRMLPL
ncbi:MAG: hypothetical protein E6Q97_36730 [Desulfurellales bacterium]|nr:MAG: hypothetical protein E6Q97_36730 [Desulfurellales bacterium]